MSVTLLELCNDLRLLLRGGPPFEDLADSDLEAQTLIRLINRAKSTVLESRTWPFDRRYDGILTFQAPIDVTVSSATPGFPGFNFLCTVAQNAILVDQPTRMWISNSVDYPNTTYRLISVADDGGSGTAQAIITPAFLDTATLVNAEVRFFASERRLPATVREVLSVKHEERPLQLRFTDEPIDLDGSIPRNFDAFRDPEWVVVGGTVTDTYDSDDPAVTSGTTGTRIAVWPPVLLKTVLHYAYVYRHPDLSAATDVLDVPTVIRNVVVSRALLDALTSNVQADPARAEQVRADYLGDLNTAIRELRPDKARRLVPRIFGSSFPASPYARWENVQVPEP